LKDLSVNYLDRIEPNSQNKKYNNFLNTSYTVDYIDVSGVSKYIFLLPNGKQDTSLNQNTTITKKLFDDYGVVFTQNAWKQVKNFIFNFGVYTSIPKKEI